MPAAEGGGGGGATWALLAPWGRDGISSCMPLLLARALSTTPDVKDAGRAGPRGRASGTVSGIEGWQVKKLVQRHGHEGHSDGATEEEEGPACPCCSCAGAFLDNLGCLAAIGAD